MGITNDKTKSKKATGAVVFAGLGFERAVGSLMIGMRVTVEANLGGGKSKLTKSVSDSLNDQVHSRKLGGGQVSFVFGGRVSPRIGIYGILGGECGVHRVDTKALAYAERPLSQLVLIGEAYNQTQKDEAARINLEPYKTEIEHQNKTSVKMTPIAGMGLQVLYSDKLAFIIEYQRAFQKRILNHNGVTMWASESKILAGIKRAF
jgi:hypothetical protein